jgi:glycosyltransferase involved in cell wall biosynthesis
MRTILHVHNKPLPPHPNSGGSNRLIEWLAQEQTKRGHNVYVMSFSGHSTEHYGHIKISPEMTGPEILALVPDDVTDIELHGGIPKHQTDALANNFKRFIQIIHAGIGGGKNSVYVSRSHAQQSGGKIYAYNGIPVDEYRFSGSKEAFLLFIAKVKRSKKGVQEAINVAKRTKNLLIVAGGHRLLCPETWFRWHPMIKPVGYVGGDQKFELFAKAKAVLVPVKWEEPFGLTVIEAMASGTPVIAFNRGAMPELIVDGVTGFLCDTEDEMVKAVGRLHEISPSACREHVARNFNVENLYLRHAELLDMAERTRW